MTTPIDALEIARSNPLVVACPCAKGAKREILSASFATLSGKRQVVRFAYRCPTCGDEGNGAAWATS